MTDYKELCAALREEAEAVKAIEWDIPICTQTHIIEAAEAIEKLMKERDAAIDDLREIAECQNSCRYCSHNNEESFRSVCINCDYQGMSKWEWRGEQDD